MTVDEKHRKNAADLDAFVTRLSASTIKCVEPGKLCGPIHVPGSPLIHGTHDLFFAKAVRRLR
jgi:hypothetical protein